MGQTPDGYGAVVRLQGTDNEKALEKIAEDNDGVFYINTPAQISRLLKNYRVSTAGRVILSYGIIFLLLIWRYGLKRAALVLTPPLLAALLALAMLGWFGQALTLFNLIALLLVLGIGIDYSIFFAEAKSPPQIHFPSGSFIGVHNLAILRTAFLKFRARFKKHWSNHDPWHRIRCVVFAPGWKEQVIANTDSPSHSNAQCDVLIIGAGPAGTTAAAFLNQAGFQVTVLEKTQFPRFVIGESLLPQCMDILKDAHLLEALKPHGFQIKKGSIIFQR